MLPQWARYYLSLTTTSVQRPGSGHVLPDTRFVVSGSLHCAEGTVEPAQHYVFVTVFLPHQVGADVTGSSTKTEL